MNIRLLFTLLAFSVAGFLLTAPQAEAQRKKRKKNTPETKATVQYDTSLYNAMKFRNIGPYRGGRSAAVTGVPGQPRTFFMGSTGGGVWKTEDAGQSWENLSDGYFGGSIGAVAVSEYDPNVIYVGGGEKTVRGNVSHGYGVWKSVDGGKTWKQSGLEDSRHIPRIRIHPRNPDVVYAAVMGHLFGPNEERGVYRSQDGGKTWENVLFVSDTVGAVDLTFDPTNPRVLYASTWNVKRTPWSLESGGEGSALWKSTDSGDNWTKLNDKDGLPDGIWGISGVTVSPVNSQRVWAIIENENGGVFRSDDGGETWRKVNAERKLRQRAWYYTRIYADPKDEDKVYVVNVRFHRSKDGGRTFESIRTPHGDHHDLWINPDDTDRMIVGDDGGAQVTIDGGETFSTYYNQPTAQFYRVTTDNHFPYRIYAAQQDNTSVRIASRTDGDGISENDWEATAGFESGHLAPHPENPDIVYGGNYTGIMNRYNHRNGQSRSISVWPDVPMGWAAKDIKYRFQWNFPLFFSPHDANTLYAGANILFKTTDEGHSWEAISPDLTRNDTTKMYASGGPITKDNTSVEWYGTIFAALESPHEAGVIWAGSDDGLIHITQDGGENWQNVTPPASMMPEWTMINSLEAHPTEKGGLYIAATGYKLDDFRPYLFKTTDYGQTWTKITDGIDPLHFTRVIRADPEKPGLLYAGTESGLYVSFDDGASWQSFQRNLPIVPITDMAVKEKDLIVATQGRALWVMDDLSPLHQLAEAKNKPMYVYKPRPTYRFRGDDFNVGQRGANPPNGVVLRYYLQNKPDTAYSYALKVMDAEGNPIRTFKTGLKSSDLENKPELGRLDAKEGMNQFVWNMRYPSAKRFDGLILFFGGGMRGPHAVPGDYKARLVSTMKAGADSVVMDSVEIDFEILRDPRSEGTQADIEKQFDYLNSIVDKLSEIHQAIIDIRQIKSSVAGFKQKLHKERHKELIEQADEMVEKLSEVEKALYQTKNRSAQDPLNFPIRLNNKLTALGGLAASGDYPPTVQDVAVRDEIFEKVDEHLSVFYETVKSDVPKFNKAVAEANVPLLQVGDETEAEE